MGRARVYLDEDVYAGVAAGLRRRGFDVLTGAGPDLLTKNKVRSISYGV